MAIFFLLFLGMTAELQKHWEAEDDLLNMQTVLDETDLKLLDAKCEIQRLNKKISDESQNEKHMEEQFEAISGMHIELNKGARGHSPIFKQKHNILGQDFDFAYKKLIWNKNYHCKSKNNQFMNILSFEQKFY